MKKKKIVIATDNFLPRKDGITRFLQEILPTLNENFDVTVICPNYGVLQDSIPYNLVRIPLGKSYHGDFKPSRFSPLKISRAIKDADLIFTQTIGPIGSLAIFLGHKIGKTIICYVHSIEWELIHRSTENNFIRKYAIPITKKITKHLYNSASLLIVPSKQFSEIMSWENISTSKKIVHLGVDVTKFKKGELEDINRRRKNLGFTKEDFIIGYHGRISREKDLQTLVRAFANLEKKHENLKLLLVGDGLPKLIEQFKKVKGVKVLKSVDDVEKYLQIMDLFCLTSLTETTSLSTLEAMATELPVVSTKVGFVKDYIVDEKNGLFFQAKNWIDLSEKIEKLIKDKNLREQIGKEARKTVTENFRWELTKDKLVKIFEKFA